MSFKIKKVLELILEGRKKTPWGKSLGMPPRAITLLFNHGTYPADKYLTKIMKSENVSMDALWGMGSAPFMVHRANSIAETNEDIELNLEGSPIVHLITSTTDKFDELPVFVFSEDVVEDFRGPNEFKYTSIHVLVGPTDHVTANLLKDTKVLHKQLPEDEFHLLSTGYKGTYYLFGKATLVNAKPISYAELSRICCKKATSSAALLNKVMTLIDETVLEEGVEITPEQKRKLVIELYGFAVAEGFEEKDVSPNLAQSMLRIV